MKICPKCQTECSDDAVFCAKCGSDLPAAAPAEEAAAESPAFCPKCGKPLEPGAAFCPGCGYKLNAKAAKSSDSSFIKEVGGTAIGMVTKPVETVEKAAKSKGIAWIIFAALAIISFTFATATNIYSFFYSTIKRTSMKMLRDIPGWSTATSAQRSQARQLVRESTRDAVKDIYSWGLGVLWSFIIGSLIFFGVSLAIFFAVKVILKKDIHLFNAFNLVGAASIPLTIAFLLNLVLGLVWTPLAVCLTVIAVIASITLLFVGMCNLADFEKKPAVVFICALAAVAAVVVLIGGIILSVKFNNLAKDMLNAGQLFN
jgi:hypothetical protein